MLTFDTVASAAHVAAWLAVICAVGFFACYVWNLRDVFWCPRGRRGRAESYSWHLVVTHSDTQPCLRETMDELAETFPGARLWVVAEPTATRETGVTQAWFNGSNGARLRRICDPAASGDGDHASLVERVYAEINAVEPAGYDPNQVLVGFLDSSSALPAEAFDYLAGRHVFADTRVGGAQVAGYVDTGESGSSIGTTSGIRERALLRAQDLDGRGPEAAAQLVRRRTRAAALGGPGQFLRLSALADIRGRTAEWGRVAPSDGSAAGTGPRNGADLLDDQGPTLDLWTAGWGTTYTRDVAVRGAGVADLGRYVGQRRAWAHATMRRIGELRRVGALRGSGRDIAVALMAPWACLVGTVLLLVLGIVLTGVVLGNPAVAGAFVRAGGWIAGLAFIAIAVGEYVLWGVVYGRRFHPRCGLVGGVAAGLVQVLLGVAHVFAVWCAFADYLRAFSAGRGSLPRRGPARQAGGRRRSASGHGAPAPQTSADHAWVPHASAPQVNQRPPAPASTMVTTPADPPAPGPVPAVSASVADEPTREARDAPVWPSTVPAPARRWGAGSTARAPQHGREEVAMSGVAASPLVWADSAPEPLETVPQGAQQPVTAAPGSRAGGRHRA